MKDVFSAFGTEVFRPLVTLILPGALAIAPYFIALMQKWADFYRMVDANHSESAFILFLIALFVGLVIEDLGARLEAKILDKRAKQANANFEAVWWSYMTHEFQCEPPGRRYLRALVIRLKFELGAAIALALFVPGFLFFDAIPSRPIAWSISSVAILLSAYLAFIECPSTHEVLGDLRAHLVNVDGTGAPNS